MPNGGTRNMQYGGLFSTATGGPRPLGFYLGSQDPLARVQNFDAQGRYPYGDADSGIAAGMRWLHLPDNLRDNSTATMELDYAVVIAAIDGDWCSARARARGLSNNTCCPRSRVCLTRTENCLAGGTQRKSTVSGQWPKRYGQQTEQRRSVLREASCPSGFFEHPSGSKVRRSARLSAIGRPSFKSH